MMTSLEFWAYEYRPSKYHHAMEVERRASTDAMPGGGGGGQGHITHKAWQFGDLSGVRGVKAQVKSSWELDMALL